MQPIVLVDSNALHGLKAFSNSDFKKLLALSKSKHIRLVVPEVVVHELSRQAAKEFNDKLSSLRNAHSGVEGTIGHAQAIGLPVAPPVATFDAPPPTTRAIFFDSMTAFFHNANAETPTYSAVSVTDLLGRDLDNRKPFTDSGKGFRDALIWMTIKDLCDALTADGVPIIFVTNNHTDFCAGPGRQLHSHLRDEIDPGQPFDVVTDLNALLNHALIEPLTAEVRTRDRALTQNRVEQLVDNVLSGLIEQDLEPTIGVYEGNGLTSIPIDTRLSDTAFDEITPDNTSIAHDVFRTGGPDEFTIRVTVEADCSIEGFIDKSEYLVSEDDSFGYVEEWNDHVMRASEQHRLRFTLSADFTPRTIDDVELTVEGAQGIA